MALCHQNCSCDREKLLKFEAAKLLRSLEQSIETVKGQTNFWNRKVFEFIPGGVSDLMYIRTIVIEIGETWWD